MSAEANLPPLPQYLASINRPFWVRRVYAFQPEGSNGVNDSADRILGPSPRSASRSNNFKKPILIGITQAQLV